MSSATPAEGDNFTYNLTLTNGGPNAAPNVTVRDQLPAEVIFVSANASQGTYSAITSIWTVGSVANNAVVTVAITVRLKGGFQGHTFSNTAEVASSDASDPDSTPSNNVAGEDDQISISVQGSCASSSAIFNVADGDTQGLIAAITSANNETCFPGANTITLATNSIYNLTQVYSNDLNGPSGLPTLDSTITIEGNGSTIQRTGAVPFRILTVSGSPTQPGVGGNVTLNRLTISNGLANQTTNNPNYKGSYGGGILNVYGTLVIINSTITGNGATMYGGGIYSGGTTTVSKSLFSSNRSISFAIGAAIMSDGVLSVTNSTFSANKADATNSSIIFQNNVGTPVTLTNNTFGNNTAPYPASAQK